MAIFKVINKTKGNRMIFPSKFENDIAIERLKEKEKYEKLNCNMEELHKQQDLLKQVILSNGKQDFFTVFDMECNVGKTYTAVHSIPYYFEAINKGLLPQKGILIVIREIEECDKYEKILNDLYSPLNSDIALAFHSKKYIGKNTNLTTLYKSQLIREIGKFPVLLITHENYLKLALNKKARNTFTKNRRLLIIDESIDICKTMTLEKQELEKVINSLANEHKEQLLEICRPILDKFEELEEVEDEIKSNTFNFKVDKERYLKLIKIFDKQVNLLESKKLKEELKNILKTIECIYIDTCIINKSEKKEFINTYMDISVMNRKEQMWTLETSIILDASAKLEPQYDMNPQLYFLMNNKPVLDHSNWNIKYVYYSSTKSTKKISSKTSIEEQEKRISRFYKGCSQIIEDLGEDETFVVCSKEEHIVTDSNGKEFIYNPYEDCNIPVENIQHFGNITGKNDYGNLKNVLITHTINYSETDYILKYMYFSGKRYSDNAIEVKSRPVNSLGSIFAFDDKGLQEFKEKTIANHMYQAICRVNRQMQYNTNVVIISKYLGSIFYIQDMLNCSCEQTNKYDNFFYFGENPLNEERKQNSKKNTMVSLFENIMNGNMPPNMNYTIINSHLISVTRDEIKTIITGYNPNKDNEKEKKKKSNKFDKCLFESKEFIKDNGIIYVGKMFYFVPNSPLK